MAFSEVNMLVSERIPLDKIILKYVKLEPSSKGYKGLCPFHKEKTPSFYVNTVENFFYCFGCGASGNAITFLMMKEGYTFSEAVKFLAKEYNIPELLTEDAGIDPEKEKERKLILEANNAAAEIFSDEILKHKEAEDYLFSRGLNDEMIRKFRIGFAGSGENFIERMKAKGIDTNTMMRAGLIRIDNHKRPVSFFYNRIMVPITKNNSVIGFGGRLFSGNGPKYLNSSDSPVFNKSENLFGIDNVRGGLKNFPFVVLCEGYFDVIAMFQNGFETAVASLGTSVTEKQMELMSRFNKPVVIFLDGDDAGRKAAKKIVKLDLPEKIDLRVALIKNKEEDPDSILQKKDGQETVKQLIELARPLFQEILDEQIELYNGTENLEEKIKIEKEIRKTAERIPFIKKRTYNLYIQKKTSNAIKISYNRNKRISDQLEKAVEGVSENRISKNAPDVMRLARLLVIASIYNEFVPSLEEIKEMIFSTKFALCYENMVTKYYDGENFDEIINDIDPGGTMYADLEKRPLSFVEQTFQRDLAKLKFTMNSRMIELLSDDSSDESLKKIWELTLINRTLKEAFADNKFDESDNSKEY